MEAKTKFPLTIRDWHEDYLVEDAGREMVMCDTAYYPSAPERDLANLMVAATNAVVEIPASFIADFAENRHFFAANDIDIVARKDGKEYRLEGDWLKPFVAALSTHREGKQG